MMIARQKKRPQSSANQLEMTKTPSLQKDESLEKSNISFCARRRK